MKVHEPLTSRHPGLTMGMLGWASVLLSGCWTARCEQPEVAEAEEVNLRVLSYNVGNGLSEEPYPLRLRDQAYEDHVGARIRALKPDIVLLQEVLPPNHCDAFEETDPGRTCFDSARRPPAARRLLGTDYTIACDANRHIECVGVRVGFGSIRSVGAGKFALAGAQTTQLPGPACDALANECNPRGAACDEESSISTVIVDTRDGKAIRVVHVHPTATGEICLQKQAEQAFELVDELPALLAGDWNFDPTRATDLAPASAWFDEVGSKQRFRSHAPFGEACGLEPTIADQRAALDRVVSDFAVGRCRVWDEPRLDHGFEFDRLDGKRIDHFAVECELTFEED